ncbi:PQQ-dependent sugar dehydrogenase [Catenuloplanes atrovinosus]|uniref:Glucose/arabinose dehydrogenase n=1 Tax=Catenuloplanes atrovinosus TaxID=137266 RepID=A0AAE4C8E4_9ACTN|nr:PQQ-dependent sugar dehydrogenase [Catenuloplanes atrovinosus]MDR7273704.1 glucose/arabinose dehydrogenase [Catenuloplanes atrovinosus]
MTQRAGISLGLALTVALAAGCGGDEEPPAPAATSGPPAVTSAPAPAASSASPRPAGPPDLGADPQAVATGLEVPWGLAFLPDGSAFVAERESARIRLVPAGGGEATEIYEVPGVEPGGEGGLLGLAVGPDFATDRWLYAYFTAADDNRIVRVRVNADNRGVDGDPEEVFTGIAKANIHNGGRIAFGPDGMLYAGTGDANVKPRSQDPRSPNGKILRLTPDGDAAPGNPTEGSPVYSLGHRNVQGLAWDADGKLWATEFGQNRLDEVNQIEPGRNYGWPDVEGEADTAGGKYTNPKVTWGTSEASPSGMAIAGDTIFVAALRGERLWTIPLNGQDTGEPRAEFSGEYGRIRTVEVAPDGALWMSTSNTDGRGDPRDDDDRILRFPAS